MTDETRRMTDETFLSRWARRKVAARQEVDLPPAPVAVTPANTAPPSAQAPAPLPSASPVEPQELPTIDSLQGVLSDYQSFMAADVDPNIKRSALKKLFSDPHFHFAQMDKLDIYIDDYGIPDPIPAAMFASLRQAKSLLFNNDSEEKATAAASSAEPVAGEDQAVSEVRGQDAVLQSEVGLEVDPQPDADDPVALKPQTPDKFKG